MKCATPVLLVCPLCRQILHRQPGRRWNEESFSFNNNNYNNNEAGGAGLRIEDIESGVQMIHLHVHQRASPSPPHQVVDRGQSQHGGGGSSSSFPPPSSSYFFLK
jgi:hypothetical protein